VTEFEAAKDVLDGGGEVEGVVATELIELLLQEQEQLQFEQLEADNFRPLSADERPERQF